MKLFVLSDASSIHTCRWVTSLSQRGCDILLFSLLKCDLTPYESLPNVQVYSCDFQVDSTSHFSQRLADKFIYLRALRQIRKQLRHCRPDLLHAHYASSFGLLGALSSYHPFLLSLWGSDVYIYPRAGKLYESLLRFTLRRADRLLSTSHCMAREAARYTDKPMLITPFGVDLQRFHPEPHTTRPNTFVVGNVKALRACYGIDVLIRAFSLVCQRNPQLDTQLLIAGIGPDKEMLEQLCSNLHIADKVRFLGYIPNEQLPQLYSSFDVAVSLSHSESFGVVAVEAMSCGCPVVTSDADGFCEVVEHGVTGFVVPKADLEAAADALQRFIDNPQLRDTMGAAGRARVEKLYDWEKNVDTMMEVYNSMLNSSYHKR